MRPSLDTNAVSGPVLWTPGNRVADREKKKTHLGKTPHMEQLGVGYWYERLSLFVEFKPYK